MSIQILLETSENRGDHHADVLIAIEYIEGETIEHLIKRCGLGETIFMSGDAIQIRVLQTGQRT